MPELCQFGQCHGVHVREIWFCGLDPCLVFRVEAVVKPLVHFEGRFVHIKAGENKDGFILLGSKKITFCDPIFRNGTNFLELNISLPLKCYNIQIFTSIA